MVIHTTSRTGKFYVGITSQTRERRMQQHLREIRAAYWTKTHKPLEIIYTEDLGITQKAKAEKHENKMVRERMKQRGINNVRGGDLTEVDDYTKRFGSIWKTDDWRLFAYVIFTMIMVAYFIVEKYFL